MNYALRGKFPSLHRPLYKIFLYMHCFGYPELIFPLINCFNIILFRLLETNVCWDQSSYAMNVPISFIILLVKVKKNFP